MSKLIRLPLFGDDGSILLHCQVKFEGNRLGFAWLNPSHIVSVEQTVVLRLNQKPYVTFEEISAMPSLSNEYTELQRSLNEQLSSGGLIEFEGNFYRFQEYDAMRIHTVDGRAYFSPMTWKEFHSYWSNHDLCGFDFINSGY